jgi:hypothetical protein
LYQFNKSHEQEKESVSKYFWTDENLSTSGYFPFVDEILFGRHRIQWCWPKDDVVDNLSSRKWNAAFAWISWMMFFNRKNKESLSINRVWCYDFVNHDSSDYPVISLPYSNPILRVRYWFNKSGYRERNDWTEMRGEMISCSR